MDINWVMVLEISDVYLVKVEFNIDFLKFLIIVISM